MSNHLQLRRASFAYVLARLAALGSPLVGALVLLGWTWDVAALKSVKPGLPPMVPTTALGFILAGSCLWLLGPGASSPVARRTGTAFAWVLLVGKGGLSLAQGLLLPSLGSEGWLFQWTSWAHRTPPPPAPLITASCFVLLGASLLGLRERSSSRWTDVPVLLVLLLSLFSFNTNLHATLKLLLGSPAELPVGMGLHTSVTMMLLGSGVLCAQPDRGLLGQMTQDTLGGLLARWLVPVSVLGPTLVSVLLEVIHRGDFVSQPTRSALFSTVMSLGGVTIVLLSAQALNRIEAERHRATARHLSKLQAARAELEQERSLFQAVVEHAPVGILFVDPVTDEVRLNSALQHILGEPTPSTAGRRQYLGRLLHLDGRPVSFEDLPSSRALQGAEVPAQKYLIQRAQGPLPVLAAASAVHGPQGELRGVIVCVQDMSAHQELERLREEYVGLISHDLRTPLQNISLRCQLLLRSLRAKGLEAEERAAEALLRNTRRMSGMVEELLEGSRLESRPNQLSRALLDLSRFVEEILDRDVPPDVRERLRLEVATPLPWICADSARLERVLVNLLTNALKYSAPDKPVVVRLEQEGSQVRVSVRDQGPGLQPEELARLFTKYYRAADGQRVEGVGLGLYISRLIIEAHGGHIHAESTPGQGSAFIITLPLPPPMSQVGQADRPAANGSALPHPF